MKTVIQGQGHFNLTSVNYQNEFSAKQPSQIYPSIKISLQACGVSVDPIAFHLACFYRFIILEADM